MHRSHIAKLLPEVRGVLPFGDIAAANRMCATLCDVLELVVSPPAPATLGPETVVAPALTPTEFLHAMLLDGPRPAKTIERIARERHGWPPRVLFKARRAMRVKAIRHGFGPGGHWMLALPGHMTDKVIYFDPDEWRNWIAGHRVGVYRPNPDAAS
jgi:hypothetical protein